MGWPLDVKMTYQSKTLGWDPSYWSQPQNPKGTISPKGKNCQKFNSTSNDMIRPLVLKEMLS